TGRGRRASASTRAVARDSGRAVPGRAGGPAAGTDRAAVPTAAIPATPVSAAPIPAGCIPARTAAAGTAGFAWILCAPAAHGHESAGVADDDSVRTGDRRRGELRLLAAALESRIGRDGADSGRGRGKPRSQARRQDERAAKAHRDFGSPFRSGQQEED